MSELDGITNFAPVAEDLCTSGQPRAEQFQAIAAAGYAAVVNLALPTSDHALADEGSIVTGLGMRYFHIPVVWEPPTVDDLRAFLALQPADYGL